MNHLIQLCVIDDIIPIEKLLNEGCDINGCNEDNITPLQMAAAQGNENVVRFLIIRGAHPDQGNTYTPLINASRHGHNKTLSILLQHNANVNIQNKLGVTALMASVRSGHLSAVRCLLDAGAEVDVSCCEITPLMIAAQNGFDSIVKILLDRGADVNFKSPSANLTALMYATLNGHKRTVQILVEHGADVDFINVCEKTALDIAISRGKRGVKGYLDQKTNIKFRLKANIEENLFEAIKNSNVQRINELLTDYQHLKNVRRNEDKITPLMYAINIGNLDVVKVLIDNGADLNLKDDANGWTALMHAIVCGRNNILKYLLDCGTEVNIRANNGVNAFYLACLVDGIDTNLIRELATKTLFYKSEYSVSEFEKIDSSNIKDWRNRLTSRFRGFKFGKPFRIASTSQSAHSLQIQNETVQNPRAKSAAFSRCGRKPPIVKWKSEENISQSAISEAWFKETIDIPSSTLLSDRMECVIPSLAFDASFSYHKTEMPPGKKYSHKISQPDPSSRLGKSQNVIKSTQKQKASIFVVITFLSKELFETSIFLQLLLLQKLKVAKHACNFSKIDNSATDKLHSILSRYSLLQLEPIFIEEEIDFEAFLCLTEDDLKELGISAESRMQLLSVIREIKYEYDLQF